jgi:hypothetical protein
LSEPEVPDEAYIAAAIADAGFAVVRSNACGMPQARVGFKHPHAGYSNDGSVSVSEARAREYMAHEQHPAEPDDHPAPAELSAAEPGEAEPGEAEPPFTVYPNADGAGGVAIIVHSKPDSPKKLKKPRKKPTT